MNSFEEMCNSFQYVYRIPPDVDDSSVNIALTGILYKLNQTEFISNNKKFDKTEDKNNKENKKLQETVDSWFHNNSNYEEFYNILKFKAYRPFKNYNFSTFKNSGNNYSDIIETRTYFVLEISYLRNLINKKI